MSFSTRNEQKQILNEYAELFGYKLNNFVYIPKILLHDFEAMAIYKFMDTTQENNKSEEAMRIIACALYMAKHGLKNPNDLPWRQAKGEGK